MEGGRQLPPRRNEQNSSAYSLPCQAGRDGSNSGCLAPAGAGRLAGNHKPTINLDACPQCRLQTTKAFISFFFSGDRNSGESKQK